MSSSVEGVGVEGGGKVGQEAATGKKHDCEGS